MFPDPARVASSWCGGAGDGEESAAGKLSGERSSVDTFDVDRSAADQSDGGEGRHGDIDAQRAVGGEASALGDDEDAIADVGRDAVDQVVVGVDDDGLSRPYVNADVATSRQVDRPERWDGSSLGSGDA